MAKRALVTADLHFTDNARDSYRLSFARKCLPDIIKQQKIEELYILGDLTETKDRHSAKLVNAVVSVIDNLAELVDIIISKGNHDYTEADSPFFGFLDKLPNVEFISRPTLHDDRLFLPHTRTPEKDWKGIDFKQVKMIFAHQTFIGATGSFGHELDGISLDLLPKHIPIVSGDVHAPQHFGNLMYVGAPYSVDFGDDYHGRVLVIDKDIESVHPNWPQKRVYRVQDLARLPKDRFLVNDVLRVEVPIKRADYAQWPSVNRLVRAWAADIKVKLDSVVPVIVDKRVIKSKGREIKAKISDEQMLLEYAKLHKLDERTTKVGLELLT